MPLTITPAVLEDLCDLARKAGEVIMEVYHSDFEVYGKKDDSPVTEADRRAEAIITPALVAMDPSIPVVAEEAFSAGDIPVVDDGPFWLVDPLDGTKQFISKKKEFTVNIALIENKRPIAGVVYSPALERMYWGALGQGAYVQQGREDKEVITVRKPPVEGVTAVVSRSHKTPEVDDFLKDYTVDEEVSSGSSIKFCLVAEGAADLYPRFGPTMEWDTAAGHALVLTAGGTVKTPEGEEFMYAKDGFKNGFFIARGLD